MADAPRRPQVVVLSDDDPVARGIRDRWGPGEPTGGHVDGTPVRRKGDGLLTLRRPGAHLHDEHLDRRLPPGVRELGPTMVFPSVHRSRSETRCLTVHPLGNTGAQADLGGRPRTLDPTDPHRMSALLRALDEAGAPLGLPATYEATHHGPELAVPALFVEVAVPEGAEPSTEEIAALAAAITSADPDPRDRVALGVGGGHYAPRFGDLARSRRWAFGHILSRHALADLEPGTARAALDASVGADGVLFARALDRTHPAVAGLGPELREADAPFRGDSPSGPSGRSPRTSGT